MSIDSLMDTSKEIFKIDKEILTFKIINPKNLEESSAPISISEEEILITNLTQSYLAFQIKTTKKNIYAVNPSHCIISPNEVKKIKLILYKVKDEELDPKKHKFRFEGFIISENDKEKDAKNLFNDYIKKGNKVIGNIQKRSVKYFIEEEETMEKIKKEEIHQKNQNNINEEKNKENFSKNIEKDLGRKISIKYFLIGVFIASIFIAIYLFIK